MSSTAGGAGELSESQQTSLQTYMTVTGQEPDAAIPILQRSQWNVQVSLTDKHYSSVSC
jgi:FAS-associated factor 2